MFELSSETINTEAMLAKVTDHACGALVTFEGWVRNTNEGKAVHELEYEGYEAVALKEGQKVVEEALGRFSVGHVHCVHRVGHLKLGELAVWVGVSSAHRGDAFEACRFVIDEIKHRLPIWKKEHYADGDSGWINCETGAAR